MNSTQINPVELRAQKLGIVAMTEDTSQPGWLAGEHLVNTEARHLVESADRLARRREAARVPVDYAALNALVRRQRAALTRAVRSGDPDKVVLACRDAVASWDAPGAMWPDDWSRWQRALDDVFPVFAAPQLGDLAAVVREAAAQCAFKEHAPVVATQGALF